MGLVGLGRSLVPHSCGGDWGGGGDMFEVWGGGILGGCGGSGIVLFDGE